MSPWLIALIDEGVRCWNHFCLIILHMIAHKYHVEFVTIVLESFQVCYYLFFHRSAILVDSTQSCFLWNYYKNIFGFRIKVFRNSGQSVELSSSFETAGTNVVTERQTIVYDDSQGLDWFFRFKYGILIQFQFDVISRVWWQYHKLEFCRVRLHSIITKPLNGDFAVIE